jgi:uncharacterized phage protein gp47/JayE
MPFNRPNLSDLISRAAADLESRLPGVAASLRRSVSATLARVHAGVTHGLYGYLDWLAKQIMPDTAEAEHLGRWASVWGISRKVAVAATGSITVTGTAGAVVPAGTLLQRADAAEYTTDAEATFATTTATIAVTASLAGADGNAVTGVSLSLVSPISGVQSQATIDSPGITGGTDTEDDDSLRSRLVARIRTPPHGGSDLDYHAWALEVAGVTRSWVYPQHLGLGTVGITFVCDDLDPVIPDAATVLAVQAHIDEVRPVTAQVTVFAPVAAPLDLTIRLTPNTTTVQAAVEAELADLLSREAEPAGTILVSHLREAISLAAGETDHALISPVADVTHTTGQIATLGTITWQA